MGITIPYSQNNNMYVYKYVTDYMRIKRHSE